MRKTAISAVLLVAGAAFANAEDRQVPPFHGVTVASGMHATVNIGAAKPVHLDADGESLQLIETVVEDGILHVRFRPHTSVRNAQRVNVTIQTPQLTSLGASGGSIVEASFTKGDSAISASGGSEVTARGLDAESCSVSASGGSILQLSGSAGAVALQLSGGSQLHGAGFSVRDATVQGSGGSQVELKATGRIQGALSGGSQLHARGGASATVATSGGSELFND